MIFLLARTEYPIGEHAGKVLYLLKLIYPVSLLMLFFFLLGIYLAYLFWNRFSKRLHRAYLDSRGMMEKMGELTARQAVLLDSIEAEFDKERSQWAGKVEDRDHELEAFEGRLSEANLTSSTLQEELSRKIADLREFEEKFNQVVDEKDKEIKELSTALSRTDTLRKELAEKSHFISELKSEVRENKNLRARLAEFEAILIEREEQVKELREKLGLS